MFIKVFRCGIILSLLGIYWQMLLMEWLGVRQDVCNPLFMSRNIRNKEADYERIIVIVPD
jgi:hypothetical protein